MRTSAAVRRRTTGILAVLALGASAAAPAALADGPRTGTPWVVSVGDSYISGEAGRWAGNTNKGSDFVDALGPSAYFDNATHTAERIAGCHRSRSAEVHIGGGVNSKNLACSGARTATFTTSGGDFKPGLDFNAGGTAKGQARMLKEFARTHNVKLIPLSIGGNNFNFGDVLTQCLENWLIRNTSFANVCKDDPEVLANFTPDNVAKVTKSMSTAIVRIYLAMRDVGYRDNDFTILVQNYANTLPPGGYLRYRPTPSPGARQTIGGCGIYDQDADWAGRVALRTINASVKTAAAMADKAMDARPNIRTLDVSEALAGHELCQTNVGLLEEQGLVDWTDPRAMTRMEWVAQVRILTSNTEYFQQEDLHPNYWGQLALRNCLDQAYNGGKPRGGKCEISPLGPGQPGEPKMILK